MRDEDKMVGKYKMITLDAEFRGNAGNDYKKSSDFGFYSEIF